MFGSGRCFQLELLPKGFSVKTTVRQCALLKKSELGVKIPPRVERQPTDILKALSATVGHDKTASHFKYPDDPFFSPFSNIFKRRLALSIQSGRNSAKWIFENNPNFFNAKIADPIIEAYLQKPVYDDKSEVTEQTLIKTIQDRNVGDAMLLYDICQKKKIEISQGTKQHLLELVCFYNSEERSADQLEIKWFHSSIGNSSDNEKWKDDGFAEKLFQSFGTECPLAVSAIIQGRLKYNQIEKAMQLFDSFRDNMDLSIGVYNELLSKVCCITEGFKSRWNFLQEILSKMAEKNMKPNLETLNSVMGALYQMSNIKHDKSIIAMEVMGEFTKLGIKPSLGTYHYLISIMYSSKNLDFKDGVLFKLILHDLLDQKLELNHWSDFFFFSSVMHIACLILKNSELRDLIHMLLLKDDNTKFLNSNIDESSYYRHYFTSIFVTEPIESAMEIYKKTVPSKYSPETSVFVSILKAIEQTQAFRFLPHVYHDVKLQKSLKRSDILEGFLKMAPLSSESEEGEVLNILYEIATYVYNLLDNDEEEFNLLRKRSLNDSIFSNMLITFVKKDDETKAQNIFAGVFDKSHLATLNPLAVWEFCRYCLSKQKFSLILECLKYAEKINYQEASKMAAEALPHLSELAESDLNWVRKLADRPETTRT